MSLTITSFTSDRVIKATHEWKQITCQGSGSLFESGYTHFDRVFSVNDMKFNVKLKANHLGLVGPSGSICPRIFIETESQELFVGYKIVIEYSAGGKSGSLTCNPNVGSLSKFDSGNSFLSHEVPFKSIFKPDGQNTLFEINVTYKVIFEIELKKTEMPKSKLLHKLYLEDELSDVKMHCDDKVFNCHKLTRNMVL